MTAFIMLYGQAVAIYIVKTALSSSTEMEHTSGLYLIIFAMVSWLYRKVQHFWKNLQMKLSSTRSKEFLRSWSLKHRKILKNQWLWQTKSTKTSLLVGCLNTINGIFCSEHLEMASRPLLFTTCVITKALRLQLWKVETIFLEASREIHGTVSK